MTIEVPVGLQRRLIDVMNSMQVSKQITDLLAGSETPVSARALASLGAREEAIRRIGDTYGLLTSAEVARLAGSRSKNPSEYASSKARDWTAIALRRAGALAFPAFQFDSRTGKTYPALLPVFAAFRDAGFASGVFNASREVAGLLGITVIGAVLSGRQSALLADGSNQLDAFLGGYRAGLLVAAVLVVLGGAAAFVGLRSAPRVVDADAAGDAELITA